jgi:hypothetical protein
VNDVRQLVVQLAVAKAVSDQCQEVIAAVKARLEVAMDPGDRKTAKIGSHNIGTVSYATTTAKTTANITDPDKFVQWAVENHPSEVHRPVLVDAHDVLRAFAEPPDLDAIDRLLTATTHVEPKVRPAFASKVLAGCEKAGGPWYVETGEEVPGITVTKIPGGEGKYVSARISEAQMGALMDAYQEGDLTHLGLIELATIPPALGGGS